MNKYLKSIGVIGFYSFLLLLSPLMTSNVKAQANITLNESNFRRDGDDADRFVLSRNVYGADSDVIHLKKEKVPELKNKIEIVLVSSSNVRWWKGVTVFKGILARVRTDSPSEVRFKHIDTQDDDKSESSGPINISDLGDFFYLSLEKGKVGGVHTAMYNFWLKTVSEKTSKYAGMPSDLYLGARRLKHLWAQAMTLQLSPAPNNLTNFRWR